MFGGEEPGFEGGDVAGTEFAAGFAGFGPLFAAVVGAFFGAAVALAVGDVAVGDVTVGDVAVGDVAVAVAGIVSG